MNLDTTFNLGPEADDLYAALLKTHKGLTETESAALNARLVLILMNHIGDPKIIRDALEAAGRDLQKT